MAILGMSLVSAFADHRLENKSRLLETALNSMTQGVVMFDAGGRLVFRNERYIEMYGLPGDIVKAGCTMEDIVRSRMATGNFKGDPRKYCADLLDAMAQGKTISSVRENPDGRVISVANRRVSSGYWVGTHEDITERRRAEAQSLSLAQQEQRRAAIDAAILAFREGVEGVVRTVSDSATAMGSTAKSLSATSADTSKRARGAMSTTHEAAASVGAASAAAQELLSSIAEISRQLREASELVRVTAY
jgi:methyl-accepting chemotaxis protein